MMQNNYDAIIAQTHTAEYSMHKYWARKPHNVISYFIKNIVPEGGVVLDPFCGSGVVLQEARKLGFEANGFDVNPIANLITSVLISPPDTREFISFVEPIINRVGEETRAFYSVEGHRIKYLVHETVVRCSCGERVPYTSATIKGRKKKCPVCGDDLRFNLEKMIDTDIERIYLENRKESIEDPENLEKQKEASGISYFDGTENYNFGFAVNRRILAYDGMKTSDLFTKRNFSVLSHLADAFYGIENIELRNAALLLLTASAAQCSRLIPTRNNLSTGGPAWSVPGFWVPAEHLETNPIIHIQARYRKFVKAIKEINEGGFAKTATVKCVDAIKGMTEFRAQGKYADLIFFDPPYGDSVPYLEFSAMWNSFLKNVPDTDLDYSVSDRKPKNLAWPEYKERLSRTLYEISQCLSADGKLLITFNNNDIKAWEALLYGLQKNHLLCEYVTYQVPAVISSKAQFSPEGSYISDIYSVYRYDENAEPSSDLSVITKALCRAAEARNGWIARNLADRAVILEWLRNNIKAELLPKKDTIIKELFLQKGSKLIYKGNIEKGGFLLKDHTCESARRILEDGSCDWNELYKNIAIQYAEYGFLDPKELRGFLDGHIVMDKNICVSYTD